MTDAGVPAAPETGAGAMADAGAAGTMADTPRVPRSRTDRLPGATPGSTAAPTPGRSKLSRPDVTPSAVDAAGNGQRAASGPQVGRSAAAGLDAVAQALQAQASGGATPAPGPPLADRQLPGPNSAPEDVERADASDENPLATLASAPAPRGRAAGTAPAAGSPLAVRTASAPSRKPRSIFWTVVFPVTMVLIVLAIPLLLLAGRKTVLQSTDGKILTDITDPSLPNWQAITDPTPTLLLVQTDDAGTPVGLTIASLTGDGAGGLVFVPMSAVLDLPDVGKLPLNVVAEKAGIDGLQKAVEGIFGAGMTETRVVSPQQWADLVAPVGPISLVNPDDVFVADANAQRQVLFPKGPLNLEAQDVAAYLATTSPGESDLNRLVRQKVFWEAYLRKVSASDDPNVVPGEKDSGLGLFIRRLADDRVEMFPLPVQPVAIPGSTAELYLPVKEQVSSLVARLIPFPIGAPPGARPRVRLLDGTGKLEHGLAAAPLVVEGGGQIDQIGNGPSLDTAVTQLVYYDDAQKGSVDALQKALGVGDVVKGTSAGSAVDITIILGKDYLAQPPRVLTPVSTVPNGTATTTIVGAGG